MHRSLPVMSGLVAALLIAGCGSVTTASDGGGGSGGSGGSPGDGGRGGATGMGGTTGMAGTTGTGGAGGACMFASTYTIRDGGGLIAMADTATLRPPNAFHYERMFFTGDAGRLACDPAMPACNDQDRLDVRDVEAALAHADVQAAFALATPPIYGNRAIADGPAFTFTRADGRGFTAGIQCDTPSATCMPIPPGIVAAIELLRSLIRQQRMDPDCGAIKN